MITLFMIPLIWPIILGGLLGGLFGMGTIGTILAIAEALETLKGKRFTILGETASGKTTLHHFLTTGKVYLGEYKQTLLEEDTAKNTLLLKDSKIVIRESVDIGGADEYRNSWKKLVEEADVVCYLIRGDKVFNRDKGYISLINEHISLIFDFKRKEQKLYLLITFLDIIPQYSQEGDIIRKQIAETLKESAFKAGTVAIYGSLKTQEDTERVVTQLLRDVLDKK